MSEQEILQLCIVKKVLAFPDDLLAELIRVKAT